jgi:hypothetical protein
MFYLLHRYKGLSVDIGKTLPWKVTLQELKLLTSPIEYSSKMLYPRVYELFEEYFIDPPKDHVMDCTIPADSQIFDKESIVVIDNGCRLFILVNMNKS